MFPLKKCKWGRAKCRILNSKPFYEFMRHKFFCAIPPKERPSMKELSTIIRVLSLTMREVLADESDEIKMPARLGKLVIRKFRLSQSHPYIGPKGTWFYRLRWVKPNCTKDNPLRFYRIKVRPPFSAYFRKLARNRIVDYEI